MRRVIFILATVLISGITARGAIDGLLGGYGSGGNSQATATMFADVTTLGPGVPFNVAVLFRIQPGWHLYWENPGDGGIATRVKFTVPLGYTISTPRFSVPKTIVMPGNIVNFGYEESAMVMATVTPSAGAKDAAAISAAVDWLACDPKECVPGNATMNVSIPVGDATPDAGAVAIFKQWADRMPMAPQADGPVKSVTWSDRPAVRTLPWDGAFSFTVEWKKAPNDVEWYANPGENVLVKDVTLSTRGSKTTVKFTVNANAQANAKSVAFSSVLAFDDDAGRHGAIVDVNPGADNAATTRPAAALTPAGSNGK